MISQLSLDAAADLAQLQLVAAIKLLKANFSGDHTKLDITNVIAMANVMAINYQSISLPKNT